jgi:hypothetical protein
MGGFLVNLLVLIIGPDDLQIFLNALHESLRLGVYDSSICNNNFILQGGFGGVGRPFPTLVAVWMHGMNPNETNKPIAKQPTTILQL